MSSLNLGFSEKIDAWNSNEEEADGCSHNMLRILENKIINTSRTQHILTKNKSINLKAVPVIRPATVRVRPVSSTKITRQFQQKNYGQNNKLQLGKCFEERKLSEKLQPQSIEYKCSKMRNKSVENMKRDRSVNKQNAAEKQLREAEKQSQKEEVEMKKQSLIFTYSSLKNKKENNISKFHEMEVKLRNNKVRNGSSMASQRKVNIILQRKNEIKINLLNLGTSEKFDEQINSLVPQRDIGYSRICRKVKVMFKEKEEEDLFADAHLSDALTNSKFNN